MKHPVGCVCIVYSRSFNIKIEKIVCCDSKCNGSLKFGFNNGVLRVGKELGDLASKF